MRRPLISLAAAFAGGVAIGAVASELFPTVPGGAWSCEQYLLDHHSAVLDTVAVLGPTAIAIACVISYRLVRARIRRSKAALLSGSRQEADR